MDFAGSMCYAWNLDQVTARMCLIGVAHRSRAARPAEASATLAPVHIQGK